MAQNKKAKNSKNWQQVLLETDMTVEEEDYLLKAFKEEKMHLDYAHSLALGYNNEQYYLLFIVGGRKLHVGFPIHNEVGTQKLTG
eukprot:595424-Rhodomonas_salina.1